MQDFINHIPAPVRRHWLAATAFIVGIATALLDYTWQGLALLAATAPLVWLVESRHEKVVAEQREARQLRREGSTAKAEELGAMVAATDRDFYSGRGTPLGRHIPPEGDLGQRIVTPGTTSMMVVGPPGAGKTTRILGPAVLTAPGPVLTTSVKSDLAQMTTSPRAYMGRVAVIDPADVAGGVARTTIADLHGADAATRAQAVAAARTPWTPLQAACSAPAAEVTAHLLVGASADVIKPDGGNQFWDNSSESLLTVLMWLATRVPGSTMQTVGQLLAAVQRVADTAPAPELDNLFGGEPEPAPTGPRSLDLPDTPEELVSLVRDHAGGGWRTVSAVLQGLAESYAEASDRTHEGAGFDSAKWEVVTMQGLFDTIANVAQAAGETAAGIVGNLHSVLKPMISSPAIAGVAWDDPDALDLRKWAEAPADTLHLVAPIKADVYRGFFSALVTAAVTEIVHHAERSPHQKLERPALIVLDELASVCTLPDLKSWLSTTRAFRVKFALGIQSPAQLRTRYGADGWYEILSNCPGGVIVLPGLADVPGLKDFQTLGGQRNLREITTSTAETQGSSTSSGESKGRSKSTSKTTTKTETIQRTDLASPAAIREQPRDQAFCFAADIAPLQVQTQGVWEDDVLRPLAFGEGAQLKAGVNRLRQLQRQAPPAQ